MPVVEGLDGTVYGDAASASVGTVGAVGNTACTAACDAPLWIALWGATATTWAKRAGATVQFGRAARAPPTANSAAAEVRTRAKALAIAQKLIARSVLLGDGLGDEWAGKRGSLSGVIAVCGGGTP
jgi:hypothetical protein